MKKRDIIQLVKDAINEVGADAYGDATLTSQGQSKSRFTKTGRPPGVMEDEDLKEFTDYGQEGRYPKKEKPGDMFQQKEVEDLFPNGMVSRSDKAFQARVKQHADWTEQRAFNTTFVHMQYHETKGLEDEYFIYQTQFYNSNYDDFRNPRFTMLSITKNKGTENEEDLGQYIVDTSAYVKDLKTLENRGVLGKRVMESPLFRTGVKMDMAPEVMAPRLKKVFDKVNGAKDPVKTPEWHKNRFKNKYGISFPETLKGINKDQALAMNKYANDMSIRETKNIKEIGHLVTTKGGETKYMDIEPKVAQQIKGDPGVTDIETVAGDTIKEDDLELTNNIGKDDYVDDEGRMAKSQMYKTGKYAMKLHDMLDDMEQLPAWVQAKLTKASDYLSAVYHYLDYEFVRRDSNLMEHVDKHKKRSMLMEGAMKKFFEMFDQGKTDEEIVQDYAHKGTTVPETFVTKARRQYEGMKKLKLELEMSEKEFRNSSEKMVNNAEEGIEPGMEEKKLASKLYNEEEVDEVSYDNSGLENPKAADISKDGDISDYELKRGKAIEKAIDKQKNK